MASMEFMSIWNSKSTATSICDSTWEAKMPTVFSCAGNEFHIDSLVSTKEDGVIQVVQGGYYVATAVINNDSTNQGHSSIRKAPGFRFHFFGSGSPSYNGTGLSKHTYQRTSGQECGAYLKEPLFLDANMTIQIDCDLSGDDWQANFDLSHFRLERMMPGDDQDELHFIKRQSTAGQSLNSTVALQWNSTATHHSGSTTKYVKGTNVVHDTSSNNTRWYADVAGIYRAHAHVVMGSAGNRDCPVTQFRKNGTDYGYACGMMGYIRNSGGHTVADNVVEEIWNLNANDYIECMSVNRNGGGTANTSHTFMYMEYLGPKYA
jgi:hypothetical protein